VKVDINKQIEILKWDYEGTNNNLIRIWERRNKLAAMTLIAVIIAVFEWLSPKEAKGILSQLLFENTGHKIGTASVRLSVLSTFTDIALLTIFANFAQRQLYLVRYYPYLTKIEKQLNKLLGYRIITRESEYYQAKPQLVFGPFHLIYDIGVIFPVIIYGVWRLAGRVEFLYGHFFTNAGISIIALMDIFILLVIIASVIIYYWLKNKTKSQIHIFNQKLLTEFYQAYDDKVE